MQKNVGSQKLIVFAFDSTTNLPKTGDAANITAYVSIDWGSVTVLGDTSATEMDATNAKGYYLFDLTQGETNGNTLLFSAKSSTSNIVVIGVPAVVQTVPSSFVIAPGSANALTVAGSNAATTFSGLTTGALACTTITASGAVAFQSTFAVATSTSLGALSCTTLTASGAVALQSTLTVTGAVLFSSTFATTGTTTLAALTTTGTMTVNAFTCSNNFTISGNWLTTGTTTWTGAAAFSAGLTSNITGTLSTVTTLTNLPAITANWLTAAGTAADFGVEVGGAVWDIVLASHLTAGTTGFALNAAGSAGDPWGTALPGAYGAGTAGHIVGTALPDIAPGSANGLLRGGTNTATTFATLTSTGAFTINGTSDVAQTGDSFARIGVAGVGLTNVVLPSGGLANITAWSVAITGNITGNLSGSVSSVTSGVTVTTNNDKTGYTLTVTPPTAVQNADALLGRNVAGGSSTGRIVSEALYALRNKVTISGSTMTVFLVDDTTTSWTATMTTDAAALPITSMDPS